MTRRDYHYLAASTFLWLSAAVPTIGQTTIYVDEDSACSSNCGGSWSEAYNDLQPALAAAELDDEVWVADGTYTPVGPGGNRNTPFELRTRVAIYGGFEGADSVNYPGGETTLEQRNPKWNLTILSGDLNGNDGSDFANNSENSYHVVRADGTEDTAILDGFVITAR